MKLNIIQLRLISQQLLQPQFASPRDLTAWFGAIQGQDYPGAKWSLGLRLSHSTDSEIEQTITKKTLLRTWLMRGTLHLAAAEDIPWLLNLIAPTVIAQNTRRYKELELDEETLSRSTSLLKRFMEDERQASRNALLQFLEDNGVSTLGQRGAYLLQRASLEGTICQNGVVKNMPQFVELDLSLAREMEREEALEELTRRYFTSRGPATIEDFFWWSGLPAAEARAGLEAVRASLVKETIGGGDHWGSPLPISAGHPTHQAFLLSPFDEFILAYRDRSASIEPGFEKRVHPGGGTFNPTLLLDGKVIGVWKRTVKKKSLQIEIEYFEQQTDRGKEAVKAAAFRYGEYMGLSVEMVQRE